MDSNNTNYNGLKSRFSPLGIWAFSIGASLGWGSIIVTCSSFLEKAGVHGTAFGLLAGMFVILIITWNLQYMIRNNPDAGGIYTFEKRVGGKEMGFVTLWFVLLAYFAVLWANLTAVPLFVRFFFKDAFKFGFHYRVFGYDVWFGECILSIAVLAVVLLLCSYSRKLPEYVMILAALAFVFGFMICAGVAFCSHDSSFSYSPLFMEGSSSISQVVRIASISSWAFIGFESISHFSEEYSFAAKKVRGILLASVIVSTVVYILVCILTISAYPQEYSGWLEYIRDAGNLQGIKALPMFYAVDYYMGRRGVTILMLALLSIILTSIIGNMMALSRLLYAAGREGELPKGLSLLNSKGIPYKALGFVAAITIIIPFLGRTTIGWIVDVTTLGATLIYGLIAHGAYLCAKKNGNRAVTAAGMVGMVLMGVYAVLLLVPGVLPFNAMETQAYALFIAWSLLGMLYFWYLIKKDKNRQYKDRMVAWVIFLVLLLFCSMMWVSRVTENAADQAVKNIYEYHQENHDGATEDSLERDEFLDDQAGSIANTTTLYTMATLLVFVISLAIMLSNYRENQKLLAEKAMEDQKIYYRLAALNGNLIALYLVDPETEHYREYSSSKDFQQLDIAKEGENFFKETHDNGLKVVYSDDQELFTSLVNRESVFAGIKKNGLFELDYRLVLRGKPNYIRLKAAIVEEDGKELLIVGLLDVNSQVMHEIEYAKDMAMAKQMASKDELTGVGNKHAYSDLENQLNEDIKAGKVSEFALVVCDVNGLKIVNDLFGHKAGDVYLQKACEMICNVFVHSPVFRIGGDEFVVVCQGRDYDNIGELMDQMTFANNDNRDRGEVQVAYGMSKYDKDESVVAVFERADKLMYERKAEMKAERNL